MFHLSEDTFDKRV